MPKIISRAECNCNPGWMRPEIYKSDTCALMKQDVNIGVAPDGDDDDDDANDDDICNAQTTPKPS